MFKLVFIILISIFVFIMSTLWVGSTKKKDGLYTTSNVFIWVTLNLINFGLVLIYVYENYLRDILKWY